MSHRLYKNFVKKALTNPIIPGKLEHSVDGVVIILKTKINIEVKAYKSNMLRGRHSLVVAHVNATAFGHFVLYQGPDPGWEMLRNLCVEKLNLRIIEKVLEE